MSNLRTFRLAAVASIAALAVTACGSDSGGEAGGDGDGEGITIGIKFDQPGLGLKEGDTYTGMGVDVATALAEKLGYSADQITWQESPSPQREQLLKTGQVDMIVATYSITDARKEEVSFAGPYFIAGQSLLVRTDSDITGLDDSLDGKLLCSVTGSTSAQQITDKIPNIELQEYQTYSECAEQVANGTLDVLTTDDVILAGYANQEAYQGKLKLVGDTFSEERFGVGLPKGSEQCEEINGYITELWEAGTMETIISDNLGDFQYNQELNPPEAAGNCT